MILLSLSLSLATPFADADRVTFTDAVNLRASPDTEAEVVATLPLGTDVDVVTQGKPATIWGITAPWVQVTADGQTGWLWSGLLTDRFHALDDQGNGVVVGLRGLVVESEYSVRVSVEVGGRVDGKVLEPARSDLTIPTAWTAQGVPFGLEVVRSSGIPGADPVVRLHYSADFCGGLMGNLVWARHGDRMVHLATLPEGSDAPVFLRHELVFPGEEGGKPGVVMEVLQSGEHGDDGKEHYERDDRTEHRLVDGRLVPPLKD